MTDKERKALERSTGELALLASRRLAEELGGEERDLDTKKARDLSGILKDMTLLGRELGGVGPRTLEVRFAGGTETAGE